MRSTTSRIPGRRSIGWQFQTAPETANPLSDGVTGVVVLCPEADLRRKSTLERIKSDFLELTICRFCPLSTRPFMLNFRRRNALTGDTPRPHKYPTAWNAIAPTRKTRVTVCLSPECPDFVLCCLTSAPGPQTCGAAGPGEYVPWKMAFGKPLIALVKPDARFQSKGQQAEFSPVYLRHLSSFHILQKHIAGYPTGRAKRRRGTSRMGTFSHKSGFFSDNCLFPAIYALY